ncbi:hypothetical protein INR49_001158 [Caranx melampygus]|nr:hypothetical protein INR49_001158 [Caranx melampygus]
MGDSDDEFDRRRRDKFRRERSDMERSREREERRRDDWPDRDWDRGRERRRDYDRGRRERFSPPRHISPQHKRMRRDWDDHRGEPYRYDLPYGGGGAPFPGAGPQGWHPDLPHLHPHHGGHPLQGRLGMVDPDLPPPGPPTMRSFKEFLLNMEDSVDETEAVKRYNQYKLDFRRQQLQDFFLQHKDQEWFRSKYHPDDITARKAESLSALKTRLGVFLFLLDNSWLDNVSLDMDHGPAIIKLLDAAVIKMEGGTDLDLQVLEAPTAPAGGGEAAGEEEQQQEERRVRWIPARHTSAPRPDQNPAGVAARGRAAPTRDCEEEEEEEEAKQNGGEEKEEEKKKDEEEEEEKSKKGRKRKRSMSADSGEGSASDSDSSHSDGEKEEDDEKEEEEEDREDGFLRVALSDPQPERRRCWVTFDRSVNIKETCWNLQNIRMETNPVLKNITDYLIEEVSAEEEELTGAAGATVMTQVTVETDDKLLKVLDRLLLYLRLVHSVDYYNFCEYPAEDEMPHRCGLIHVRGPLPVAKITAAEETLSEEEAARLGKKDPEQEVEKFLSANTQELSKDKWLCPLSGKKFKAPEFVRKHILNKHAEKVAAVRQEVEFFNNFLLDAKRPALPENKPLLPPAQATPPGVPGFPGQSPQQQSLLGYPPGVRPPMPGFPGGGPPYPPISLGRAVVTMTTSGVI